MSSIAEGEREPASNLLDHGERQIEILVDPTFMDNPASQDTSQFETTKTINLEDGHCTIESHPGEVSDLATCNTIEFTTSDCTAYQSHGDFEAAPGLIIHHSGIEVPESDTGLKTPTVQRISLKKVSKASTRKAVMLKKSQRRSTTSIKKRFCPSWFNIPEIEPWLEESILPNHAYCKFCQKDLTAGKSELYKHMNTAKHQRKAEHYGFAPAIKNEAPDELDMMTVPEVLEGDTDSCGGSTGAAEQDLKLRHPPVPPRLPMLRKFAVYLADDMHVAHSKEMLEVIHNVGSDPCTTGRVRELEHRAAHLLGKEAAMFVLTGSMANSLAVMAHCPSNGSVVLAGDRSHLYRCCQTTLTRLNQVNIRVLRNTDDGRVNLDEVSSVMLEERDAVRPSLLCLENSHTFCGGQVLPEHYMQQVGKTCAEYGLKLHVDGARLLHAAFACELSPALLSAYADSVTLCFNKGLEAQNGSVIAGSEDFITRCRQLSDVFCVSSVKTEALAATCSRALAGYVQHIARAQLHARNIVRSFHRINTAAVTLVPYNLYTNVILLECDCVRVTPQHLIERLRQMPPNEIRDLKERVTIIAKVWSHNTIRLMTHSGLTPAHVAAAIKKLRYVLEEYDNYLVLEYNMPPE